jgi:hypothetical protein
MVSKCSSDVGGSAAANPSGKRKQDLQERVVAVNHDHARDLTFEDADALFGAVRQVLEGIEKVTLEGVFLE